MLIQSLSVSSVPSAVKGLRPPQMRSDEIARVVSDILADVRLRDDEALVSATARLDWPEVSAADIRVPVEDLRAALERLDSDLRIALELARDNCAWFHRHELVPDWEEMAGQGQRLGIRQRPVRRAGLYVPGGLGSYASSVIMNVVPAQVAGVAELAICTPPGRDGSVNESVMAAAHLLGVEEVYRLGGAQAVGALAYGTETVGRVDVISGPGNAYVNEAKRQVFGIVGIDSLAGPSEVLVIADLNARVDWVAADLLAQEEHGSGAEAVLMGHSAEFCAQVSSVIEKLRMGATGAGDAAADVGVTARGADAGDHAADADSATAEASSRLFAFYPEVGQDFVEVACALADEYAPEHLEIHFDHPRDLLDRLHNAGAIFLGHHTPTAFGDYVAGSNHVLPTGGSARFASALGVQTFMRRQSLIELGPEAAAALAPPLARLAESEGFSFHKHSAQLRGGA